MTLPSTAPVARRSTGRRVVAALVAIPLILATVVVARLIAVTTPIPADHRRPWIHSGQMNEAVHESEVDMTVHSVRGGRSYTGSFDATRTTDGLFLLVRATVVAPETKTALRYAELFDDAGNAYSAIDTRGTLLNYELLPGIPVDGELLFEVPPAVVTQLRVRVSTASGYSGQYQVMVEVPLEIDTDAANDWYHDTTEMTLTEPEVAA
jgi:hypothetical protein